MSIDWSKFDTKVGKYFTLGEVCIFDNRRLPASWDNVAKENILTLASELDKLRTIVEHPIHITSWFRPSIDRGYTIDINKIVGGSSKSQHRLGSAADIAPPKYVDGKGFEKFLDCYWRVNKDYSIGYGQKSGKGFTHLDLRKGGIFWNY